MYGSLCSDDVYIVRFDEELTSPEEAPVENLKTISAALFVLPVSLLVMLFLPREIDIRWRWAWAATALLFLLMRAGARTDKWSRKHGRAVPAWMTFVMMSIPIFAAGMAVYAASGPLGTFREALLICIILFAVWGDAAMSATGTVMTLGVLAVASYASGIDAGTTATLVVEYGVCWGITSVITRRFMQSLRQQDRRVASQAADEALYAAKSNGRNRVELSGSDGEADETATGATQALPI